ncbi:MAG: hypothetical protein QOK15_3640 [Nocardioidaceae bacterium]|nr:hypothetical protein [Nocardioidaceae bacterium]
MRLLSVELGRLRSRRAVAALLLLAVALAALLVGSAAYDTRPVNAADRAVALNQLAQARDDGIQEYRTCLADPEQYLGSGATAAGCESTRPDLSWFLPRAQLHLADEIGGRGQTLIALLAVIGAVVGATFCGADWSSGSLGNQLLFVPRRGAVWLAKAVAVVVGMTAVAAVLVGGFWAALQGVAASRGLATSAGTWREIEASSGRGLAMVAAATLGSFALTMLLRSTVATLGLLLGGVVLGEGLAAGLPFDRMTQWSPSQNVAAWLSNGIQVYDDSTCRGPGASCLYTLPLVHAAVYLGVLLLLAVVVSMVSFRRRDIA